MIEETTNPTEQDPAEPKKRGRAALPPEERKRLASIGGKAAHASGNARKFTPEEARAAGRKGGAKVAQNREHMAEIGRKGGLATSAQPGHAAEAGKVGAEATKKKRARLVAERTGELRECVPRPSDTKDATPDVPHVAVVMDGRDPRADDLKEIKRKRAQLLQDRATRDQTRRMGNPFSDTGL